MVRQSAPALFHDHPAARALTRLDGEWATPTGVTQLKKKQKGSVYRLEGVGPDGSAVIAKHSSVARIQHERAIYEQVLPLLPLRATRAYGSVDEPEHGGSWLFLEDAGGVRYLANSADHRALAAAWLARLHTSAAHVAAAARLPERGPEYYREHLRSAYDQIAGSLPNPVLSADDRRVLTRLLDQCDLIAAHWREVEQVCEGVPRTLIHGDFAPKNMCVRGESGATTLLPFDWGSAGWGLIAADLVQAAVHPTSGALPLDLSAYWASPDLADYVRQIQETWPHVRTETIQRLAVLGKLFRCCLCMDLDAVSLPTAWVEGTMWNMRVYQVELADAIHTAGWER